MTFTLKFAVIAFAATAALSSLPAVSMEENPSELPNAGTAPGTETPPSNTGLTRYDVVLENKEISETPHEITVISKDRDILNSKKVTEFLENDGIIISSKTCALLSWPEQILLITNILNLDLKIYKEIFYKNIIDDKITKMDINEKQAFIQ